MIHKGCGLPITNIINSHQRPTQALGKLREKQRVCVGFPWGFGRPHDVPIRSLQEDTISHCKNSYIHTYTHTYIHTYIHIHTYILTYIHTYTYTYIYIFVSVSKRFATNVGEESIDIRRTQIILQAFRSWLGDMGIKLNGRSEINQSFTVLNHVACYFLCYNPQL